MKKTRRKILLKGWILSIFIVLLLLVLVYDLLAVYYRWGFSVNTWINGIYCTGKTAEEVNAELVEQAVPPVVVISTDSGRDEVFPMNRIDLAQMGYRCDYLAALNEYLEQQNPFLWFQNITLHREHRIEPEITYDEDTFRQAFEQTCVRVYSERPSGDYVLRFSQGTGWECEDGLTHVIDMDRAFELVKERIAAGQYEINIDRLDCFYDIPFTETQKQTQEIWERLQAFLQCDLQYDMGDTVESPDRGWLSGFVTHSRREDLGMEYPVLDETGEFVLDQEAVERFVQSLADQYDTYGKERLFHSTRGDLVTVPAGGTYGTTLDQEQETAYLMEHLLSEELHDGIATRRIPAYLRQGFVRGQDDLGDTYIEVDMTDQHMYYYRDGVLILDTDVVTGNTGRRMGTPEGVNYIYYKQRNRTLRGPGYATPVKYWMAVKGHVGIHDSGWRSEYGGTIYQKNGSHGCINTPPDMAAKLYEMAEIGTPVILFY